MGTDTESIINEIIASGSYDQNVSSYSTKKANQLVKENKRDYAAAADGYAEQRAYLEAYAEARKEARAEQESKWQQWFDSAVEQRKNLRKAREEYESQASSIVDDIAYGGSDGNDGVKDLSYWDKYYGSNMTGSPLQTNTFEYVDNNYRSEFQGETTPVSYYSGATIFNGEQDLTTLYDNYVNASNGIVDFTSVGSEEIKAAGDKVSHANARLKAANSIVSSYESGENRYTKAEYNKALKYVDEATNEYNSAVDELTLAYANAANTMSENDNLVLRSDYYDIDGVFDSEAYDSAVAASPYTQAILAVSNTYSAYNNALYDYSKYDEENKYVKDNASEELNRMFDISMNIARIAAGLGEFENTVATMSDDTYSIAKQIWDSMSESDKQYYIDNSDALIARYGELKTINNQELSPEYQVGQQDSETFDEFYTNYSGWKTDLESAQTTLDQLNSEYDSLITGSDKYTEEEFNVRADELYNQIIYAQARVDELESSEFSKYTDIDSTIQDKKYANDQASVVSTEDPDGSYVRLYDAGKGAFDINSLNSGSFMEESDAEIVYNMGGANILTGEETEANVAKLHAVDPWSKYTSEEEKASNTTHTSPTQTVNSNGKQTAYSVTEQYLKYATDEQINILKYYAARGDKESAQLYLNSIMPTLKTLSAEDYKSDYESWVADHPFTGVAGDAVMAAGAYSIIGAYNTADQLITGGNAGQTSYANVTQMSGYTGEGVAEALQKKFTGLSDEWANNIAGLVVSMTENIAQGLSVGTYLPAKWLYGTPETVAEEVAMKQMMRVNEWVPLVVMGSQASTAQFQRSLNEGESIEKAAIYGGIVGAVEILTEKMGMDEFVNASTGNATLLQRVASFTNDKVLKREIIGGTATRSQVSSVLLKMLDVSLSGGAAEGLEEVVSEIADYILDVGVSALTGDESEYAKTVESYMAGDPENGVLPMTYSQAVTQAILDWGKNIVMAGVGGFVSGIGFSGMQVPGIIQGTNYEAKNMLKTDAGAQEFLANCSALKNMPLTTQYANKLLQGSANSENYKITAPQLQQVIDTFREESSKITAAISNEVTGVLTRDGDSLSRFESEIISTDSKNIATETQAVVEKLLNGEEVTDKQIKDTILHSSGTIKAVSGFVGQDLTQANAKFVRQAFNEYNRTLDGYKLDLDLINSNRSKLRDVQHGAIKDAQSDNLTASQRLVEDMVNMADASAQESVDTSDAGVTARAEVSAESMMQEMSMAADAMNEQRSADATADTTADAVESTDNVQEASSAPGAYQADTVAAKTSTSTGTKSVNTSSVKNKEIPIDGFVDLYRVRSGNQNQDASPLRNIADRANKMLSDRGVAVVQIKANEFLTFTNDSAGEVVDTVSTRDQIDDEIIADMSLYGLTLEDNTKTINDAQKSIAVDNVDEEFQKEAEEIVKRVREADKVKAELMRYTGIGNEYLYGRDSNGNKLQYSSSNKNLLVEALANKYRKVLKKYGAELRVSYTMSSEDEGLHYIENGKHIVALNGNLTDGFQTIISETSEGTKISREHLSAAQNISFIAFHEFGHMVQGTNVNDDATNERTNSLISMYAKSHKLSTKGINDVIESYRQRYIRYLKQEVVNTYKSSHPGVDNDQLLELAKDEESELYQKLNEIDFDAKKARQEFASDCLSKIAYDYNLTNMMVSESPTLIQWMKDRIDSFVDFTKGIRNVKGDSANKYNSIIKSESIRIRDAVKQMVIASTGDPNAFVANSVEHALNLNFDVGTILTDYVREYISDDNYWSKALKINEASLLSIYDSDVILDIDEREFLEESISATADDVIASFLDYVEADAIEIAKSDRHISELFSIPENELTKEQMLAKEQIINSISEGIISALGEDSGTNNNVTADVIRDKIVKNVGALEESIKLSDDTISSIMDAAANGDTTSINEVSSIVGSILSKQYDGIDYEKMSDSLNDLSTVRFTQALIDTRDYYDTHYGDESIGIISGNVARQTKVDRSKDNAINDDPFQHIYEPSAKGNQYDSIATNATGMYENLSSVNSQIARAERDNKVEAYRKKRYNEYVIPTRVKDTLTKLWNNNHGSDSFSSEADRALAKKKFIEENRGHVFEHERELYPFEMYVDDCKEKALREQEKKRKEESARITSYAEHPELGNKLSEDFFNPLLDIIEAGTLGESHVTGNKTSRYKSDARVAYAEEVRDKLLTMVAGNKEAVRYLRRLPERVGVLSQKNGAIYTELVCDYIVQEVQPAVMQAIVEESGKNSNNTEAMEYYDSAIRESSIKKAQTEFTIKMATESMSTLDSTTSREKMLEDYDTAYVIMTGSRNFYNQDFFDKTVDKQIREIRLKHHNVVIVCNTDVGVGRMAINYANSRGINLQTYDCKWFKEDGSFDKYANKKCNQEIMDYVTPHYGKYAISFVTQNSPAATYVDRNFSSKKWTHIPFKVDSVVNVYPVENVRDAGIYIASFKDVSGKDLSKYAEVWILGKNNDFYRSAADKLNVPVRYVEQLAPSYAMSRDVKAAIEKGTWSKAAFDGWYTQAMNDRLLSKEARAAMNYLYLQQKAGKPILLLSNGSYANMDYRSIIGKKLDSVGIYVNANDQSIYPNSVSRTDVPPLAVDPKAERFKEQVKQYEEKSKKPKVATKPVNIKVDEDDVLMGKAESQYAPVTKNYRTQKEIAVCKDILDAQNKLINKYNGNDDAQYTRLLDVYGDIRDGKFRDAAIKLANMVTLDKGAQLDLADDFEAVLHAKLDADTNFSKVLNDVEDSSYDKDAVNRQFYNEYFKNQQDDVVTEYIQDVAKLYGMSEEDVYVAYRNYSSLLDVKETFGLATSFPESERKIRRAVGEVVSSYEEKAVGHYKSGIFVPRHGSVQTPYTDVNIEFCRYFIQPNVRTTSFDGSYIGGKIAIELFKTFGLPNNVIAGFDFGVRYSHYLEKYRKNNMYSDLDGTPKVNNDKYVHSSDPLVEQMLNGFTEERENDNKAIQKDFDEKVARKDAIAVEPIINQPIVESAIASANRDASIYDKRGDTQSAAESRENVQRMNDNKPFDTFVDEEISNSSVITEPNEMLHVSRDNVKRGKDDRRFEAEMRSVERESVLSDDPTDRLMGLYKAIMNDARRGPLKTQKAMSRLANTFRESAVTSQWYYSMTDDEIRDAFGHDVQHVTDSVTKALNELGKSDNAWREWQKKLSDPDFNWASDGGTNLDIAMIILARLQSQANNVSEDGSGVTVDEKEVLEWAKLIRKHATEAGEFINAFKKYKNTAQYILVDELHRLEMTMLDPNARADGEAQTQIRKQGDEDKELAESFRDAAEEAKEELSVMKGSLMQAINLLVDRESSLTDEQRQKAVDGYAKTKAEIDDMLKDRNEELQTALKRRAKLVNDSLYVAENTEHMDKKAAKRSLRNIQDDIDRIDSDIRNLKYEIESLEISANNVGASAETISSMIREELRKNTDLINKYCNQLLMRKTAYQKLYNKIADTTKFNPELDDLFKYASYNENDRVYQQAISEVYERAMETMDGAIREIEAHAMLVGEGYEFLSFYNLGLLKMNETLKKAIDDVKADIKSTEIVGNSKAEWLNPKGLEAKAKDASTTRWLQERLGVVSYRLSKVQTDNTRKIIEDNLVRFTNLIDTCLTTRSKLEKALEDGIYTKDSEDYKALMRSCNYEFIDAIRTISDARGIKISDSNVETLTKQDFSYQKAYAMTELINYADDFRERTVGQRLATYQYLAQLLNVRTAARNIFANSLFYGLESLNENTIGKLVDAAISKTKYASGEVTVAGTWWHRGITDDMISNARSKVESSQEDYGLGDSVDALDINERTQSNAEDVLSFLESNQKTTLQGAWDRTKLSYLEVMTDMNVKNNMQSKYYSGEASTSRDTFKLARYDSAKKRIWSEVFHTLETANGVALNVTDEFFKGATFQSLINSYAGFVASGSMSLEHAVDLATREMKYRTFQDDTWIGSALEEVHGFLNRGKERDADGRVIYRDGNGNIVTDASRGDVNYVKNAHNFGAGDVICKYRTVPGALVTRALEYSPAGAAFVLASYRNMKNDSTNAYVYQRQVSMGISRMLTGSTIIALLTWAAYHGILKRRDLEEDLDVRAAEAANGMTGVQFNWSALWRCKHHEQDGVSWEDGDDLWEIGFLEPYAGAMTAACAIAQLLRDDVREDGKNSFFEKLKSIGLGTMTAGFSVLDDLAMMDTFSDLIYACQYAKNVPDGIFDFSMTLATSTVTSFMPSIVRQFGQAFDSNYRDSWGTGGDFQNAYEQSKRDVADGNDSMWDRMLSGLSQGTVDNAQQFINQLAYNSGIFRKRVPIKQDTFGQDKRYTLGWFGNAVNALFNPSNYSKYTTDEVKSEIARLYDSTGKSDAYPDRKAVNYLEFGKDAEGNTIKVNLTYSEKQEYLESVGYYYTDFVQQFMGTESYKNADDLEKVNILDDAYNYARFLAKRDYYNSHDMGDEYKDSDWNKTEAIMREIGSKQAGYTDAFSVARTITKLVNDDEYMDSNYDYLDDNQSKYLALLSDISKVDSNINLNDYQVARVYDVLKGDSNSKPTSLSTSVTDSETHETTEYDNILTTKDKSDFNYKYHEAYDDIAEQIMSSDLYQNSSFEEQAEMLSSARNYAKHVATEDYWRNTEGIEIGDGTWGRTRRLMQVFQGDDSGEYDYFAEANSIASDLTESNLDNLYGYDMGTNAQYMHYVNDSDNDWTDDEKLAVYKAILPEDSVNQGIKIADLMDNGITYEQSTNIYTEYSRLRGEDQNEGDDVLQNKQTQFDAWLRSQGYNEEQRTVIEDNYRYTNITYQDVDTVYAKLADAGVSNAMEIVNGADAAANALGEDASEGEKSRARVAYVCAEPSISTEDKVAAVSALYGTNCILDKLSSASSSRLLNLAKSTGDYSVLNISQGTELTYNSETYNFKDDEDACELWTSSYSSIMDTFTSYSDATTLGKAKTIASAYARYQVAKYLGLNPDISNSSYSAYKRYQSAMDAGVDVNELIKAQAAVSGYTKKADRIAAMNSAGISARTQSFMKSVWGYKS